MAKTTADVFELIAPADPDSIRSLGGNEFLLNWLKDGFTDEQLINLQSNKAITVLDGPYKPIMPGPVTHQIRIKVL